MRDTGYCIHGERWNGNDPCPETESASAEEAMLVEQALSSVDSGSAGHWPTVAGILAGEVRKLRAVPAEE